MKGIEAGAAVQFQNVLPWLKDTVQVAPNGKTAGLADHGASKIAIIGGGSGIPVGL
jgi:hypothetical protein